MKYCATTLLALLIASISISVNAGIISEEVDYTSAGVTMKGLITYDDSIKHKRPGVLVVHEWWGHNAYARDRARQLAELGYTAMAVDMYGGGKTADHPKDAGAFSSAVGSNLPLAQARFQSAIDTLMRHDTVADNKIAAIGYCFGGGIVLQMARMGVDIAGVASFHGSLKSDIKIQPGDVKAAVRVFNGADDPFVKAEDVAAIEKQMRSADVDFELINYPGAKHSFTNPGATAIGKKFGLPLVYNESADKDSWKRLTQFLEQLFD